MERDIFLGEEIHTNYFLSDFPGHKNYDRDVLVVCDEPEKENSVNQLLEYFETIWEQEDSGYFHDNKKLANRKSVKNAVLELQNGYQKYFEENKERSAIPITRTKLLRQKRFISVKSYSHRFQRTSSVVSVGRIDEKCKKSCEDPHAIYYL